MPIATHNIVLKPDAKHEGQPFLVACSCGTEGRFAEEGNAMEWANEHIKEARSVNITFQNLCLKAKSA